MRTTLSNLIINNIAPTGTIIGALTTQDKCGGSIPCTYRILQAGTGIFGIAGNELITAWSTPPAPALYLVFIQVMGTNEIFNEFETFEVNVVASAPPPPPPPAITVNGSTNAVVTEGATLATAVANGPGNTTDWVGLAAAGSSDTSFLTWDYLSGSQTPPHVGLTSATLMMTAPSKDGRYEARFYANNGYTVLARATFTVAPPPPPSPPPPDAPSITVNGSSNAAVLEGSPLAMGVANGPASPTDWVGLAGAGTPDTAYISWAYLNGSHTAPTAGMTSANLTMTAPTTDGAYEARFYANNGFTVLARAPFTVAPPPPPPPQPVITVTPSTPEVPDTTSRGAVVATFSVAMSDGSPFTGKVGFGAPYYDAGGIFALSGNRIIVNPNGPGLGPNMTTITDHITLETIP